MNWKLFVKRIALMLLAVFAATLIDWAVHSTSSRFYVEFEYYRNKVLFGTIWGLIGFFVFRRIRWVNNYKKLAVLVSLVIAATLQAKYFFLGYDKFFVFLFFFLHFLMFLPPMLFVFKKFPRVFGVTSGKAP